MYKDESRWWEIALLSLQLFSFSVFTPHMHANGGFSTTIDMGKRASPFKTGVHGPP
jgi:hypothetical protein